MLPSSSPLNTASVMNEKLQEVFDQVKIVADNIDEVVTVSDSSAVLLDIQSNLTELLNLTDYTTLDLLNNLISSNSDMLVFETKQDLIDSGNPGTNGTQARVFNDPNASLNTVYVYIDGWTEDQNYLQAQVSFLESKLGLTGDVAGKYLIGRADGEGFEKVVAVDYAGDVSAFSPSLIKQLYEQNQDTNAFADLDKYQLAQNTLDIVVNRDAISSGAVTRKTLAEVEALAVVENQLYRVTNDPGDTTATPVNGFYIGNADGTLTKENTDRLSEVERGVKSNKKVSLLNSTIINPFYLDLHFSEDSSVYFQGVVTGDYEYSSTFSGWKNPFNWDGTAFDLIKLYVQVETACEILIVIEDASNNEILRFSEYVGKTGYHWFKSPRLITTDDTSDAVLHLGFTAGSQTRAFPGLVTGVSMPDTSVYDVYYTTTTNGTDAWLAVTEGLESSYDMSFSLFNSSSFNEAPLDTFKNDIAAIVDKAEKTTYSSKAPVNVALSGVSATPRGGTFAGWGSRYNHVSGHEFNLVRLNGLARVASTEAEKWVRIDVYVTNDTPDGNIIAQGSIEVDPELDTLGPMEFALVDPVTKELITLNDSNLPAQYSISYIAINSEGGRAHGGEPRGVMSNFAGNSYYIVQSANAWKPFTSNPSLAFETYLANDLFKGLKYTVKNEVLPEITAVIPEEDLPTCLNPILKNLAARTATGLNTVFSFTGDSWTHSPSRYLTKIISKLSEEGGISAPGWITFNGDISAPEGAARSKSGTWLDIRHTSQDPTGRGGIGPDAAHTQTTDTTATIVVDANTVDSMTIHYEQKPGGGVFSYRRSPTGDPVEIDTDGSSDYVTVVSVGPGNLYIDIVSAGTEGVTLVGVDARNSASANKYVAHKLGNGGATSGRFDSIPLDYYVKAHTALGSDVFSILLGTNEDYSSSFTPDDMEESLLNIISPMRTVNPLADIILIAAGPNGSEEDANTGNDVYVLEDYSRKQYNIAKDGGYAFVNLQVPYGTYTEADERGLMNDPAHPNIPGGNINGNLVYNTAIGPSIALGK